MYYSAYYSIRLKDFEFHKANFYAHVLNNAL